MIMTEQALDALDVINDCALMNTSVDAYGARHILTEYICQQNENKRRIGDLEAVLRTIANSGWTVEKTREFAQRWLDKE
jgi:hypothetical protein